MSKRRRQQLIRAGMYAVFVVAIGLVIILADGAAIRRNFFNPEIAAEMFPDVLLIAARNTLLYTFLAFSFGLALGLTLALMRLSSIAPYRWLATIYIEIFRGLPALLTIFLVGFGVPLAFRGARN
ncbi:MAG: ABC transporter permease subunit, partial [Intrasporangiaceae bacterium]|nr:ABC transporter permease subunit [Intrasporangiaceae bacterium]